MGLATWLQEASHTASLAVSAAVALLLGFSIRFVTLGSSRCWTGLFQKRHQDEEAIRRFAREAPYVTDVGTLLDRTTTVLEDRADSSFVSIALHDGNGCYGSVSENDPAIPRCGPATPYSISTMSRANCAASTRTR